MSEGACDVPPCTQDADDETPEPVSGGVSVVISSCRDTGGKLSPLPLWLEGRKTLTHPAPNTSKLLSTSLLVAGHGISGRCKPKRKGLAEARQLTELPGRLENRQ